MSQDIIYIFILLFFSALFSASETALLSLDSIKLKRIQKNSKDIRHLQELLSNPARFLTTLLIGNMFVNILLSTMITSVLLKRFSDKGLALSIASATFLLLVFGEVTPKIFAIKRAEGMAYSISRFINIFAKIVFPIRYICLNISNLLIKSMGISLKKEQLTLTQEELKSVIALSHRHGVVKGNEGEMIRSVLELTQTSVVEVMTPRPDIKALNWESTNKQACDYLKEIKHSKVPVYKNNIDDVAGILYARDLFLSQETDFKFLLKPALLVPQTKKIDDLLKDFQTQNSKIAIVVDEYGSTYGLVTLEDILEEIVGEIYDEFETKENFIERLSHRSFRVSAKASVELIKTELNIDIPEGNYDTVAGYILSLFDRIPKEGEYIERDNVSFYVEKLAGRRVKSIIIEKL